ncbi:MAG: 3-deoxy-D-manno-octulosonic acid transferase [Rickettsiales bacterium]|jgi:3-deoxy-D-manno-octulosonic-acid transferase|nr:3-deoxy-D-manno-octulosonic acid transferase [Rickettsiales bacterium]
MLYRKFKGKENKRRFGERFGKTNVVRPEGKLLWFNAVSVGEINSAWSIINRFNENGEYSILITTTTVTSADSVKNKIDSLKNKDSVIHQFAPIDLSACIKRFLKHWKPNILINIESEFWPNLFTMTSKVCPIMVLNGKMSKKSFRFWYSNRRLKEKVFDSIDICLAQSKNDHRRFINLGVQNTQFLANIKFFVDPCPVDNNLYNVLLDRTKNRCLWLVNCTHRGEEEIIIETHKILKQKYKNLMTILIIRHPNRLDEVEKLLKNSDIPYVTTSSGTEIEEETELYIYDKFGNLGTFFNLCKIVFIAGSLQKGIGGHTPAEAVRHNCCVVTGPYVENNHMLFRELLNSDGCVILKDNKAKTLADTIEYLFENSSMAIKISNNAFGKSVKNAGFMEEIIDIIKHGTVKR